MLIPRCRCSSRSRETNASRSDDDILLPRGATTADHRVVDPRSPKSGVPAQTARLSSPRPTRPGLDLSEQQGHEPHR